MVEIFLINSILNNLLNLFLDRPFVCAGCDKKYISASGLRTHWKTTSCKPNNIEEELAMAAAATNEFLGKYQFDIIDYIIYERNFI